jgi:Holliday junction resolvasome RuvABC endonuclease subunit
VATNPKVFDGGLKDGARCFVGIDQSLTGFAVTFLGTDDKYRTLVYKGEGTGIVRLVNIYTWLSKELYKYKILDVAIESPVKMSHSAIISGELFGLVRMCLYDQGRLAPIQVPPTMLKKYVTGKGTGVQKNQMLLQVYKKWGIEFTDDNAADSYGIARIVSKKADNAYEKEIINKLSDPKFRDVV